MNAAPVPTESQVVYQQVLANSHKAETRQLGITFPAWFNAALPVQHICAHMCLGRYTRVRHGIKQTWTTSLDGDKQMYNLESHSHFSLNF